MTIGAFCDLFGIGYFDSVVVAAGFGFGSCKSAGVFEVVILTPEPGVTFPSAEIVEGVIVTGCPFEELTFCTDVGLTGWLKDEPTGMSHLCPGCPCGGFMPGAVFTTGGVVVTVAVPGFAAVAVGVAVFTGWLKGEPTGMSQRWPGCP